MRNDFRGPSSGVQIMTKPQSLLTKPGTRYDLHGNKKLILPRNNNGNVREQGATPHTPSSQIIAQ